MLGVVKPEIAGEVRRTRSCDCGILTNDTNEDQNRNHHCEAAANYDPLAPPIGHLVREVLGGRLDAHAR